MVAGERGDGRWNGRRKVVAVEASVCSGCRRVMANDADSSGQSNDAERAEPAQTGSVSMWSCVLVNAHSFRLDSCAVAAPRCLQAAYIEACMQPCRQAGRRPVDAGVAGSATFGMSRGRTADHANRSVAHLIVDVSTSTYF